MNAYRIYSRRIKGLDNGVWLLMIVIMVLSLGLLSFLWMDRDKCIPFTFKISSGDDSVYYTGKTLFFDASISAKNMTWDFDDGSENIKGLNVSHKFIKEGKFHVKAIINSGCIEEKEVIVKLDPDDINTTDKIVGADFTTVGKEEAYLSSIYASTSSWIVEGHSEIKAIPNGNLGAKFRFPKAGNYRVTVTLEGSRIKSYSKDITVTGGEAPKPKVESPTYVPVLIRPEPGKKEPVVETPVETPVETRVIKRITNGNFKEKLNEVMGPNPPSLESFDVYLDNRSDTRVVMDGKHILFRQLYNTIKGRRNQMSINSVEITKDEGKIVLLTVETSD